MPDESTILRFRHLLEAHEWSVRRPSVIKVTLAANGQLLKTGAVVDPTLIAAPSLVKNSSSGRDPEMHQSKKDNPRHLGMRAHIGFNTKAGQARSKQLPAGVAEVCFHWIPPAFLPDWTSTRQTNGLMA